MDRGGGEGTNRWEKGQESERGTERQRRSRARAHCRVMLLLKCRASRPLVEAIKRKK